MRRTLEVAQHALTYNDSVGMFSSVFVSIIEGNNNVLLLYHGIHGQFMAYKSCVDDEVLCSTYRGVFLVAGTIYSRRDSNA
jgi:hypothetical protein